MWKDIIEAPTAPAVGLRGPMILGIDKDGNVHKTFWSGNNHSKGAAWLLCGEDRLYAWHPILWTELPDQFQDRDGRSFEARQMMKEEA